jgi:hypothetical protein
MAVEIQAEQNEANLLECQNQGGFLKNSCGVVNVGKPDCGASARYGSDTDSLRHWCSRCGVLGSAAAGTKQCYFLFARRSRGRRLGLPARFCLTWCEQKRRMQVTF